MQVFIYEHRQSSSSQSNKKHLHILQLETCAPFHKHFGQENQRGYHGIMTATSQGEMTEFGARERFRFSLFLPCYFGRS